MGAAGTDVFGAVVELGPEAVFSDPAALEAFGGIEEQFDQLATNFGIDLAQAGGDLGPVDEQPAGFDDVADQLSDEFADFAGGDVGDSPEDLTGLSEELGASEEFGTGGELGATEEFGAAEEF